MSKKSFSGVGNSQESKPESSSFIENFLPSKQENKGGKDAQKNAIKKTDELTRQTFMIKVSVLNRLKDFVHTKRKNEDYNYSQKKAIEEALLMLFDTTEIEERG